MSFHGIRSYVIKETVENNFSTSLSFVDKRPWRSKLRITTKSTTLASLKRRARPRFAHPLNSTSHVMLHNHHSACAQLMAPRALWDLWRGQTLRASKTTELALNLRQLSKRRQVLKRDETDRAGPQKVWTKTWTFTTKHCDVISGRAVRRRDLEGPFASHFTEVVAKKTTRVGTFENTRLSGSKWLWHKQRDCDIPVKCQHKQLHRQHSTYAVMVEVGAPSQEVCRLGTGYLGSAWTFYMARIRIFVTKDRSEHRLKTNKFREASLSPSRS